MLAGKRGELCEGGCSSTTSELLGILALLLLRLQSMDRDAGSAICLTLSSSSDNMGCGNILKKLYTSAEPGAAIVRQVARVSAVAKLHVEAVWLPRTSNKWADILSKGYTGGPLEAERASLFCPDKERKVPTSLFDSITHDLAFMGS